MKENPFDKFDKPSDYLLPGEKEEAFISNINRRISEKKKTSKVLSIKWIVGIAASLLIAATVYLIQPADAQQLAMNNYSPYKNYKEEITRGNAELSTAYASYNNGDFSAAVAGFEAEGEIAGLDALYYAIALQGNGEWSKALPILNEAKLEIPAVHMDAYDWHLALNYLALGSKEEAARIVNQIVKNDNSQYLEQAKDLAKQLD